MTTESVLQDIQFIYPEIIVIGFGILILMLDLFISNKRILPYLGLAGLLAALFSIMSTNSLHILPREIFSGMIVIDPFAVFFKIVSLLVMIIIILMSLDYQPYTGENYNKKFGGEYYSLLLFLTSGMMFMAASTNLLMIQLSIEFVSITSYILVAFNKKDTFSSESGLKYYLVGVIASGVMLYGITLLYGLTGTIDLKGIYGFFTDGTADSIDILLILLLILAGFGFKIAMVPFHFWVPDTYEGAPTPITAFLSVGSKAVGFAILFRTFLMAFSPLHSDWSGIFGILAVVTMTVGNIIAITQTNIKRLLAYSSIAHAGYILVPLAIGYTAWAKEALLIYILAYYLMNLGAFIVVIIISNSLKSDNLIDYSGLYLRSPALAASFAIFLLSLTGIPPLAGFYGKYYIFAAAIDAGPDYYWLAIAVAINSALAAYYYFRVIRQMYLVEPSEDTVISQPFSLRLALLLTLAFTVLVGIFPQPMIDFVKISTQMLTWY